MTVLKKVVVKLDPADDGCFYLLPLSLEKEFNELLENLKTDWRLYKDELTYYEKYWYDPERVRCELIIYDENWESEE